MKPHKVTMWIIPVVMIAFIGIKSYDIYKATEPTVGKHILTMKTSEVKSNTPLTDFAVSSFGWNSPLIVKPVLESNMPVAVMSDGSEVLADLAYQKATSVSRWEKLQGMFPILENTLALVFILLPIILLVFFFFTSTYEMLCWNLTGLLIVQDPVNKPDWILHDFGYRGNVNDNDHSQFTGHSHNCHGCGANDWNSNDCNYCGGER